MKHYLITAVLLIAALALYSIGLVTGALLLFASGAAMEIWFLTRVASRCRGRARSSMKPCG